MYQKIPVESLPVVRTQCSVEINAFINVQAEAVRYEEPKQAESCQEHQESGLEVRLLLHMGQSSSREPQFPRGHDRNTFPENHRDAKLPNGKSQQEEILKADYQKTLQDAAELVKLAEELQDDLIKEDRHVLSLASLKKAEDIERLAKKIRTRLKK